MVQHLYPNFLTDEKEYKRSEKEWQRLWADVMSRAGVADDWESPWLGAPLRDGDPIFSAVSHDQCRAVHVIQHAPTTSSEMELVRWVDQFGEAGIDPVIDQLVISCALSKEALALAYPLIWSWVTRGTIEEK